jgi:hypothetical protein
VSGSRIVRSSACGRGQAWVGFVLRDGQFLKVPTATAIPAVGLAMPPAASADTTPVAYAWGYNGYGQVGVDPTIAGSEVLSPVPVH